MSILKKCGIKTVQKEKFPFRQIVLCSQKNEENIMIFRWRTWNTHKLGFFFKFASAWGPQAYRLSARGATHIQILFHLINVTKCSNDKSFGFYGRSHHLHMHEVIIHLWMATIQSSELPKTEKQNYLQMSFSSMALNANKHKIAPQLKIIKSFDSLTGS